MRNSSSFYHFYRSKWVRITVEQNLYRLQNFSHILTTAANVHLTPLAITLSISMALLHIRHTCTHSQIHKH